MTVKQQQLLLAYLGYDPGTIDGANGPKTKAAIMAFQQDFGGLAVDGVAGAATEKALRHAVAYGMPEKKQTTAAEDSTASGNKTGTFWDDIQYFKRSEFRCPCGKCGGFPVEPKEGIVRAVDRMRGDFSAPVIVVPADGHSGGSGVRCQAYNDSLRGSVPNSRHVQGKAVDFSAPGKSDAEIESYLNKIKANGTIRYWYRISPGAFHMDIL